MKRRLLAALFVGMTPCTCLPVQEKQNAPTRQTLTGKPEIVFGVHRWIRGLIAEIRMDEGRNGKE